MTKIFNVFTFTDRRIRGLSSLTRESFFPLSIFLIIAVGTFLSLERTIQKRRWMVKRKIHKVRGQISLLIS